MGTELATRGPISADIEKVLLTRDLAQLSPDQRLNYYNSLCVSLGLNALTQPFQYIVLNGKLQLYAKKDCTEQLRKIHGVSINNVDPKQIGDLFVVVASASDREGRVDSATGAVNMNGLKGEALANAMMKTETKAKRRVTLSLCGLGMLDETEVDTLRQQGAATEPQGNNWQAPTLTPNLAVQSDPLPKQHDASAISHDDSEPDIKPRSQRNAQTSTVIPEAFPESTEAQKRAPQGEVVGFEPPISKQQSNRYFAIMKSASVTDEESARQLASLGYHGSRDDMPKRIYNQAIDLLDPKMMFRINKN